MRSPQITHLIAVSSAYARLGTQFLQVEKVLTAKEDHNGRTILMLAARTGNPEVFEAIASRLSATKVSTRVVQYWNGTGRSAYTILPLD